MWLLVVVQRYLSQVAREFGYGSDPSWINNWKIVSPAGKSVRVATVKEKYLEKFFQVKEKSGIFANGQGNL